MGKKLDPIPPGEILLEEFMKPLEISQNRLARDVDIPVSRVAEVIKGRRSITADTALAARRVFRHQCRVLAQSSSGLRSPPYPQHGVAGDPQTHPAARSGLTPCLPPTPRPSMPRRPMTRSPSRR